MVSSVEIQELCERIEQLSVANEDPGIDQKIKSTIQFLNKAYPDKISKIIQVTATPFRNGEPMEGDPPLAVLFPLKSKLSFKNFDFCPQSNWVEEFERVKQAGDNFIGGVYLYLEGDHIQECINLIWRQRAKIINWYKAGGRLDRASMENVLRMFLGWIYTRDYFSLRFSNPSYKDERGWIWSYDNFQLSSEKNPAVIGYEVEDFWLYDQRFTSPLAWIIEVDRLHSNEKELRNRIQVGEHKLSINYKKKTCPSRAELKKNEDQFDLHYWVGMIATTGKVRS
jgi:hypothetical protein